jgi:hypothetical protein
LESSKQDRIQTIGLEVLGAQDPTPSGDLHHALRAWLLVSASVSKRRHLSIYADVSGHARVVRKWGLALMRVGDCGRDWVARSIEDWKS